MGGKKAGYKPINGKHEGKSHWWLVHSSGLVIDITAEQFNSPVDYEEGRGRGFLTKKPCKRSQAVLKKLN